MTRAAMTWLWLGTVALGCTYEPIASPSERGDDAALPLLPALALYSQAAADWNSYVLADEHRVPCPPMTPAAECVHAGAWRTLTLPGEDGCDDLAARDRHDWFDWTCSEGAGEVVLTARLRSGVGLADLLDVDALAWRETTVTVKRGAAIVGRSAPAALWDNPVREVSEASEGVLELDEPGAVYVVRATPRAELRIRGDRVALLGASAAVLRAPARSATALGVEPGTSFVWVEGFSVDAGERATGVELLEIAHSVVRDMTVVRDDASSGEGGVDLRVQATDSTLTGLRSTGAAGTAVALEGRGNRVDGIDISGSAGDGLLLRLTDSVVSNVRVSGAGKTGVRLAGAVATTLEGISIADCDTDGMLVDADSHNDTLTDLVVANNGGSGIVLRGDDQRVTLALSASNEVNGVLIEGSNVLLMHTTVANNERIGFLLGAGERANGIELVNVISTNNAGGLSLSLETAATRVHDAWLATNGDGDVHVDGNRNVFTGALALSADDACFVKRMDPPPDPGLGAGPCRNAGESSATITFGNRLERDGGARVLLAHQKSSDPLAGALDNTGKRDYAAIADWFAFSARQRHWGRVPSPKTVLFPNQESFGRCDETSGCGYWDWRVTHEESSLRDPLAQAPGGRLAALEDPVHVRTHVWSATTQGSCDAIRGAQFDAAQCSSRFVAYAYEPRGDEQGNDNLLCEPDERCILDRNRGAYPGHGELDDLDPGAADGRVDLPGFGTFTLQMFEDNGP